MLEYTMKCGGLNKDLYKFCNIMIAFFIIVIIQFTSLQVKCLRLWIAALLQAVTPTLGSM